jgi:hypothetical protein
MVEMKRRVNGLSCLETRREVRPNGDIQAVGA